MSGLFGLFKSRHMRATERASVELTQGFVKIAEAINDQLDLLMFFDGKRKSDFLADPYFSRYAFGMFDAVTMILGLELREKLGRGLIERWFLRYFTIEFRLNENSAHQLLEKVFEIYAGGDQHDAAILDGGADGIARLRGGDTRRLLKHYGFDFEGRVPDEQLQAFLAFRNRDRSLR